MTSSTAREWFCPIVATGKSVQIETAIALGRTLASATALVALHINGAQRADGISLADGLLAVHGVVALGLFVTLWMSRRVPRMLPLMAHLGDLGFAAILTLLLGVPTSPLFLFFVFPVLAAAYRWGFHEALATSAVAAALVDGQTIVAAFGRPFSVGVAATEADLTGPIIRSAYLIIVGALVGYLGETERRRRQAASISELIVGRMWSAEGIRGLIDSVFGAVLQLFGARRALMIVHDARTGRSTLWNIQPAPDSDAVLVAVEDVGEDRRAAYLYGAPPAGWHAVARRGGRFAVIALDRDGRRRRSIGVGLTIPRSFLGAHPCHSVLSVSVEPGDGLSGRVFLLDPTVGFDREGAVRAAQRFVREIVPAARYLYRMGRVRSRAEELERARLARELHDGVLQSLSVAELRLELVRRHVESAAPQQADELFRIQALCRDEMRNLRVLTRRMQSTSRGPRRLDDDLSELVERFQRDTGISARFVTDRRDLPVSPRVHLEIARIVQEGLVNVRKHSGAHNVVVRATTVDGSRNWKLSIEDDGCGFPFTGRRSQAELDAMQEGPFVIKERVRALRGELVVESSPGAGARIELEVPLPL